MGGMGSGNQQWDKKTLVENCLTLDVTEALYLAGPEPEADVDKPWWLFALYRRHLLGIMDRGKNDVILRTQDGGRYSIPISYTPVAGHPRARRPWFICPECKQRAKKLYLPPGEAFFYCRTCHGLTYRSQQERPQRVKKVAGHLRRWLENYRSRSPRSQ